MDRRHFLQLSATATAACCCGASRTLAAATTQPSSAPAGAGSATILNNVDRYRVVEPLFEGVRVILSHRGESYTPAYIQGISGAAFRVAGICPCAPTVSCAMSATDLIKRLGYEFEQFNLGVKGDPLDQLMAELIPRIKESIRAGRPVLVWHAFTNAEWDVVCGFDDDRGLFLGRGSNLGQGDYAQAVQTRAKTAIAICPAAGAVFIGRKTGQFDAPGSETAALREAVRHARDRKNADKTGQKEWTMLEGLMAYDRWVEDFKSPARKRTTGDSYCQSIYRTTHRAAADFLNEIGPRHPAAAAPLAAAAGHFRKESQTLEKATALLAFSSPEGPDPDRNAKLWPILAEARDSYRSAIEELEKALPLLA